MSDYEYTKWLDEPQELCQLAAKEADKIYTDSCKKAIADVVKTNQNRVELMKQADILVKALIASYSAGDKLAVSDILEHITSNKGGVLLKPYELNID